MAPKRQTRWPFGSMSRSIDSHHDDSQSVPSHHPNPNPVPPHLHHPEEDLIHSQSNPQNSHSQQGTSSMSSTAKKGRGISRQISKWGKEKIHIEFDAQGQPVGEMATKLETQLGVMVRNIAPLTFTDWRSPGMEPYKERIWQEVLDNTDVPTTWRSICLQHASKKWREYKATLKRHYDCHETDKARLSKIPPGVDPEQWKVLVEYWGCEQAQERSVTNRANRDKQKMGHTSGRRSHPQVRHQMTIESGDEPDRIKLFRKTHTKKSGEIVDSTSSYIIEQMDERLSQIPTDEQTPDSVEDVFTQILGKDGHGRVRMGGLGTCPTKVRQRQQYQVPQEQYDQMRAQITAELEEKFQVQIQSQVQMQVRAILEAMGHIPPAPDNTPQPRQPSSYASASATHASTPSPEAECAGLSIPECDHHLEISEFVHLMNRRIPRHIIAEAIIVSIDPTKSVGGVELGNEFVEISIQKVLKPLYPLPRQFSGMRVLRDANNSKTTIPWRVSDIEKI
ncbi:uncharacterized protein LOC127789208 isoform X1 [Diospyros lotus]|uniref:uncharacterized protein LOC127789208 isoform X1 n=1 Tax=Diospyros lotus TaxID=55363 RepID=UPI00224CE556|nr:uncharacterized protein LOC127789208 isoform X1 [Diospyros lotus]